MEIYWIGVLVNVIVFIYEVNIKYKKDIYQILEDIFVKKGITVPIVEPLINILLIIFILIPYITLIPYIDRFFFGKKE